VHSLLRSPFLFRSCLSSPAGTALPRHSRRRRQRATPQALIRRAMHRRHKARHSRRRGIQPRATHLGIRRRRLRIRRPPLRRIRRPRRRQWRLTRRRRRPPMRRRLRLLRPRPQRRRPCRHQGYLHCLARATLSAGCITATRSSANARFRARPGPTASRTTASWEYACRAAARRPPGAPKLEPKERV
jgi:hypothetical protein